MYIMNVSSTIAMTRELKPLEAPFLLTDDPRLLRLEYQSLIYFEDWLKTIEIKPGIYEKTEKQKMFI